MLKKKISEPNDTTSINIIFQVWSWEKKTLNILNVIFMPGQVVLPKKYIHWKSPSLVFFIVLFTMVYPHLFLLWKPKKKTSKWTKWRIFLTKIGHLILTRQNINTLYWLNLIQPEYILPGHKCIFYQININ